MRVLEDPQGSDEWRLARLGVLTASEFHRVITPKTRKPSASIDALVGEKAAEWAIGEPLEDFSSGMTDRGTGLEDEAAQMYALETGEEPVKVGLILSDDGLVGASPDRLVGDDGLLEIKCPGPKAMVGYLLDPKTLEEEYRCQVMGQLLVTSRRWVDLYAYSPALPSVRVRVQRSEEFIAALSVAVAEASVRLEAAKQALREKGVRSPLEYPPEPVPEPSDPTPEERAAFDEMLRRNGEPRAAPSGPAQDLDVSDLKF